MDLKDIRLGFALTGSFCTLQAAFEQMEKLVEMGAKVQPVMSEMVYQTDTRFGAARTFIERAEALCGCPVMHRITETETIGPKNLLDAMLVAPCTGNTLGKLAHGVNDTAVTMAVKATLRNKKPVIVAVSTNDGLGASARNIGMLLNTRDFYFVPVRQDDCKKKPNSIIADMDKIPEAVQLALDGFQLQPILC